jgi:hypothetical protein
MSSDPRPHRKLSVSVPVPVPVGRVISLELCVLKALTSDSRPHPQKVVSASVSASGGGLSGSSSAFESQSPHQSCQPPTLTLALTLLSLALTLLQVSCKRRFEPAYPFLPVSGPLYGWPKTRHVRKGQTVCRNDHPRTCPPEALSVGRPLPRQR